MDYTNIQKEIGKRIKQLRKKNNNETQAQLALAINVTQDNISKIERGDISLTLEKQLAIAEHYNVSLDYLCLGQDSDTLLSQLFNYLKIEYKSNLSIGGLSYNYPLLKINSSIFHYLLQIARAENTASMPDEIRNNWINYELSALKQHLNSKTSYIEVVPTPLEFICPDDNKSNWSQLDLLRAIDIEYSNT